MKATAHLKKWLCALSLLAFVLSTTASVFPRAVSAEEKNPPRNENYIDENNDGDCDNTPGSAAGGGSGAAQGPQDGKGPRRDGSGGGAGGAKDGSGGKNNGGGTGSGGGNGNGGNGGGGGKGGGRR